MVQRYQNQWGDWEERVIDDGSADGFPPADAREIAKCETLRRLAFRRSVGRPVIDEERRQRLLYCRFPVLNRRTGVFFPSVEAAASSVMVCRNAMVKALANAEHTCCGFYWRFASIEEYRRYVLDGARRPEHVETDADRWEKTRAEARRLFGVGMPMQQIARRLRTTYMVVYRACKPRASRAREAATA